MREKRKSMIRGSTRRSKRPRGGRGEVGGGTGRCSVEGCRCGVWRASRLQNMEKIQHSRLFLGLQGRFPISPSLRLDEEQMSRRGILHPDVWTSHQIGGIYTTSCLPPSCLIHQALS